MQMPAITQTLAGSRHDPEKVPGPSFSTVVEMNMSLTWIDPRLHPDPPCRAATRPLAVDPEAIAILTGHCEHGRIYDIERWIQEGHPLQAAMPHQPWRKRTSTPLEIAVETGQWSLIQLLLVNGYRLDQEPTCPLTNAIEHEAWDVLDLLCTWGADVRRMDVEIVIGTYRGELIERLWRAGLDLGAGTGLAFALAGGTNRPLYGFIKRQRTTNQRFQFALDVALGHAVEKKKERAIALCLWAGANSHVSVPEITGMDDEEPYARSTMLRAARNSSAAIMKMLKPDPTVDDFNELFGWADDPATIDVLAARGLPADWSAVIWHQVQFASWGFRSWHECDCLERMFALGARVKTAPPHDFKSCRKDVMKMPDKDFTTLMRLLRNTEHCDAGIYDQLVDSPRFRERLQALRLIPAKRVLRDETPLDCPIGNDELKLLVWQIPSEEIGTSFGVSGAAVRKWCRAYDIEMPPKGYWSTRHT